MKKETSKESKMKKLILVPIRILKKARELYMKSVVECAGGYGTHGVEHANTLAVHDISQSPKSTNCSINHNNATRTSGDEASQGENLRKVDNGNDENEKGLVRHMQRNQLAEYKYNRKKMSYSTNEMRKMRRIDEDQPCSFEDDPIDSKKHLLYLYPRRRNNLVNLREVYNR